jgi:hypothetical protein
MAMALAFATLGGAGVPKGDFDARMGLLGPAPILDPVELTA